MGNHACYLFCTIHFWRLESSIGWSRKYKFLLVLYRYPIMYYHLSNGLLYQMAKAYSCLKSNSSSLNSSRPRSQPLGRLFFFLSSISFLRYLNMSYIVISESSMSCARPRCPVLATSVGAFPCSWMPFLHFLDLSISRYIGIFVVLSASLQATLFHFLRFSIFLFASSIFFHYLCTRFIIL